MFIYLLGIGLPSKPPYFIDVSSWFSDIFFKKMLFPLNFCVYRALFYAPKFQKNCDFFQFFAYFSKKGAISSINKIKRNEVKNDKIMRTITIHSDDIH